MPDLRLAIPAAAAWAAAGFGIALSDLWPVAISLWAVTGLVVAFLLAGRARRTAPLVAVCLAAAALTTSAAAAHQPERRPDAVASAADAGLHVRATAQLAGASGDRFTATLTSLTARGKTITGLRVPALVFHATPDGAGIGSTVRLAGLLQATAAEDDVSFLVFADRVELAADPPPLLGLMDGLRAGFREAAAALPGQGGGLLPGLAIGDTGAVSPALDADMKTSSLSHLTAVSGANCAIVIGLVMLVGGAVGVSRGWRVVASVVVLAGFVLLVTPEPSVLRAAVMAGVVLVSLALGRPLHGAPVLSAAVIVLLALDPWLSRSYGFALSVLATLGLLLLSGPLTGALARWIPRPIAALVAIPFAAQLACQPVLILLEPSIPVYGVLANILAAPAAPAATVLGSLGCVLLPVWSPLGLALIQLAWFPATWIATVARVLADLPAPRLAWPDGTVGLVLLALVSAGALSALLLPRWRRLAVIVVLLLLAATLGGTTGTRMLQRAALPPNWTIAACDVGQGDALLVRSGTATALIDTGPDPALLTDCLDRLGVDRLDLLVLTHFDADHAQGATAVLGRVEHALVGLPDLPEHHELIARLTASGARVQSAAAGQDGILGDLRWRVLWPTAAVTLPGNDASVTVAFDAVGDCPNGCLSALFLGDLGAEAQTRLLAGRGVGRVDVVKVSHHGSADQNGALYDRAHATVGLISVGADNRYGHPADALLDILQRSATRPLRTDRHGLLLLSAAERAGTVTVWTETVAGDDVSGTTPQSNDSRAQ
ncbi:MAG: ComEC/Rec2 family competence protein [Microbacteriaceae bacterium]